ncbi:MAG: flagellar biosynthetic protein FliO [bacterium]|nr:flagellar biosynthetic protein FliO [bacterium]
MKKITEYFLTIYCWLNATICFAVEKFEVLPDLPDPLAAYAQSAEASTVSTANNSTPLVGGSVGHEVDLIQVILALLFTIVLIYLAQILYTKLNKANMNVIKRQQGSFAKSQASVISTTALGNNKTLHVIELDGKRMLIGASSGAIQLIKDLGAVTDNGNVEEEFSHIEIPTIKIPKIEIPKIEIPSIGFSKLATKIHKQMDKDNENSCETPEEESVNLQEENPDVIIDSLFTKPEEISEKESEHEENATNEHIVDPDDFALYKKYI